jgi:hypothetical protein
LLLPARRASAATDVTATDVTATDVTATDSTAVVLMVSGATAASASSTTSMLQDFGTALGIRLTSHVKVILQ